MHFVIVGNGVAGINAANAVRQQDESAEITIVSYEHDHFFSRTALMYAFCGQLSNRCIEPYERDYYKLMKFNRVRDRVTRIDSSARKLHLESGESLSYDRLLIAAGSVAATAPWPGLELDGVGHFVTWQNLEWLREKAKDAKRAVVVGGGLIGIETAEILGLAGIKTTFLIREEWFWPIALDRIEGEIVSEHMRHHGIDVQLPREMTAIIGQNGRVSGVKTIDGAVLDCDIVVITIGVRPQTDWLRDSELQLDERGGIVVDDKLRTNVEDIWAAGDCTSVEWFNGVRRPEQLWYTSRDQGRVAGYNMTGLERQYRRGTFYNSAKFFDIEYTTAGLINFNLDGEQNWFHRESNGHFTQRVTYLPHENDRIVGFNGLGRRWDHRVLVRWIEEKRPLAWVLEKLHEALFDEEFMPKFEITEKAP